jgi:citronellol/citronellal dehydrogenase
MLNIESDEWESLNARPTAFRDGFLAGTVALIPGGGSGIGKTTAWLMARLGASVMICGRTAAKVEQVAAAAQARGLDIRAAAIDVRNPDNVGKLVDTVFADFGRLDFLINSAGGQFPKPAIDLSPNGWNAVVDTNLNGTWHMMQAAARGWRDRDMAGSIVNIVAAVERGMLGAAHSCAARAGVIYLSKTVAVEWSPLRIRVNCIAPGTILTEGMGQYPQETRDRFRRSNPMMRLGDPWEIAEACIYLVSSAGGFVNGELLTIDGGAQIWGEIWTTEKPAYFGKTIWETDGAPGEIDAGANTQLESKP